jgi:hypothetical protein
LEADFGADAYSERIDCFRSALDGAAGAFVDPISLEGRAGGAGELLKKSSPRRLSAGFVCFGGAGAALGGG